MFPPAFDFLAATSGAEAVEILANRGESAKVLAGGQSLIPLLKLRFAAPSLLVDIGRIPGLNVIRDEQAALILGATSSHAAIEASEMLRRECPALIDAAAVIADPLVRNMGTVGGSIVHADPSGDWSAVLLALDAEIHILGPRGRRVVPIEDFTLGPFTPALEFDELVTEIRIPAANRGSAYAKLMRKTGDFATVGVAASIRLVDGRVADIRLALTAVGPQPFRVRRAEQVLRGDEPTAATLAGAAEVAGDASEPVADARGSVEYKRAMVRAYVGRALQRAVDRAGSGDAG